MLLFLGMRMVIGRLKEHFQVHTSTTRFTIHLKFCSLPGTQQLSKLIHKRHNFSVLLGHRSEIVFHFLKLKLGGKLAAAIFRASSCSVAALQIAQWSQRGEWIQRRGEGLVAASTSTLVKTVSSSTVLLFYYSIVYLSCSTHLSTLYPSPCPAVLC